MILFTVRRLDPVETLFLIRFKTFLAKHEKVPYSIRCSIHFELFIPLIIFVEIKFLFKNQKNICQRCNKNCLLGIASLDSKTTGRLGGYAVAYYAITTLLAVIIGIIMRYSVDSINYTLKIITLFHVCTVRINGI